MADKCNAADAAALPARLQSLLSAGISSPFFRTPSKPPSPLPHAAMQVVEEFTRRNPDNPLAEYLPALEKVRGKGDSFNGLDGFEDAVQSLSNDTGACMGHAAGEEREACCAGGRRLVVTPGQLPIPPRRPPIHPPTLTLSLPLAA